jgi:hypothetical protein
MLRERDWCEHCKDSPAGQRWLCPHRPHETFEDAMPELTDDEKQILTSVGAAFDVIGRMFSEGDGTREGLIMAVSELRACANMFEGVVERWPQ